MPGKILRVATSVGAAVGVGDVLVVLEAMKMENEIRASQAGTVKSLPVVAGATVNAGEVLAVIG
jgi:biotin carboxyl carrier protein